MQSLATDNVNFNWRSSFADNSSFQFEISTVDMKIYFIQQCTALVFF